jgi:hypothetical protein
MEQGYPAAAEFGIPGSGRKARRKARLPNAKNRYKIKWIIEAVPKTEVLEQPLLNKSIF